MSDYLIWLLKNDCARRVEMNKKRTLEWWVPPDFTSFLLVSNHVMSTYIESDGKNIRFFNC